jgi:hypothetical protein
MALVGAVGFAAMADVTFSRVVASDASSVIAQNCTFLFSASATAIILVGVIGVASASAVEDAQVAFDNASTIAALGVNMTSVGTRKGRRGAIWRRIHSGIDRRHFSAQRLLRQAE